MQQITAYKASDGAIFANIEDCQDHEFSLIWRERVDDFIQSDLNQYRNIAQASMVRKTVIAWERFKTGA